MSVQPAIHAVALRVTGNSVVGVVALRLVHTGFGMTGARRRVRHGARRRLEPLHRAWVWLVTASELGWPPPRWSAPAWIRSGSWQPASCCCHGRRPP